MKRVLDVEAKLIQGGKGVFNVFVDEVRVFSRSETGRFPDPDEIPEKMKLQPSFEKKPAMHYKYSSV